jgi:TRAP-type uncharacterized transport system fused permease subunit
MNQHAVPHPDQAEIDRLIEQFDPESSFRSLLGKSAIFVTVVATLLSCWHVYTAGFGLHNEIAHRAIHLTVVLGLCFLVFPRQARLQGHWEWTVSLGLIAFYLLLGLLLMLDLGDAVPLPAKLAFLAVLLALCALSLPLQRWAGSKTHISLRDWLFAALAAACSLYLLVFFNHIFIARPGEHSPLFHFYFKRRIIHTFFERMCDVKTISRTTIPCRSKRSN